MLKTFEIACKINQNFALSTTFGQISVLDKQSIWTNRITCLDYLLSNMSFEVNLAGYQIADLHKYSFFYLATLSLCKA